MKLSSIYRKRDDIVTRRIAGETLLVPIHGKLANMQRIFVLNAVAEHVWQQLDGKRDIEEIRNEVLTKFDVEKEEADTDTLEFITQLLEADLITGIT